MKRAIIVGATSGIGQEIAKVLLAQGWKIGIAGRRKELLTAFQERNPEQIATQALDVTQKDAVLKLNGLIEQLGGMDLFLLCSGIGKQNRDLQPEIEIDTARTNVGGFIRMTNAAYTYFRQQGGGHLAVSVLLPEQRDWVLPRPTRQQNDSRISISIRLSNWHICRN